MEVTEEIMYYLKAPDSRLPEEASR